MTSETGHKQSSNLLESVVLKKGIVCRNRVAMAAMTHNSSLEDGSVAADELEYIERRAQGPGLIFTACVSVSPSGQAYDGQPAAHHDRYIAGLTALADAIKAGGAKAVLQLHHGGGVCPPRLVLGGDVVSPSGIATPDRSHSVPRELSDAQIAALIEDFRSATKRALEAGFDGVEIHGGYGYLLQQFLSPYTNKREDRWGGGREKRLAFPLAIVDAAQNAASSMAPRPFAVGYRLTPEESLDPGLTLEDTLVLLEALIAAGVDFIDVLGFDYRLPPRRGALSKDRSILQHIVQAVGGRKPVLGGGSICKKEDALDALGSGVDFITLGRAIVIEPEWVQKFAGRAPSPMRTSIQRGDRESLTLPRPFWETIWNAPGLFPVVA